MPFYYGLNMECFTFLNVLWFSNALFYILFITNLWYRYDRYGITIIFVLIKVKPLLIKLSIISMKFKAYSFYDLTFIALATAPLLK